MFEYFPKIMNLLIKVFVYGTLKINQPNHNYLTELNNGFAEYICNGSTRDTFPLLIATKYNIPFLLNLPGTGHNINGEIYTIDVMMLSKLDLLESYPKVYDRVLIDVDGDDG